MMLGGGMMLGIGLLMMLVVLGLPILLIVGIVAAFMGLWGRRVGPTLAAPASGRFAPADSSARYCTHCGQGLQAGWAHCPQCGAPMGPQ
jgi:hypothetical protein